jgi:Flp pilus assembly protein TadG
MLKRFFRDERGNYAMMFSLALLPIMGAVAIAVDYAEMSRQRQITFNALDAAGVATARRVVDGATDDELKVYAKDFFIANLSGIDPAKTSLNVELPNTSAGGGTLKLSAHVNYDPHFLPAFHYLLGKKGQQLSFNARTEVRLKNTVEVALVLDNSGSMNDRGSGSGKKRIDLLKAAAKELVDTLAAQGASMKQVAKPVQFGLVPFAASVNVGPNHEGASWLDMDGISPIHHENFDWETMGKVAGGQKSVVKIDGIYRKQGKQWKDEEGEKVTRFTLFHELRKVSPLASWAYWAGCVEMRPGKYALDDTVPDRSIPDTLFVPMFAPDESDVPGGSRGAYNDWWADQTGGSALERQEYMPKYFHALQNPSVPNGKGPNLSCTTKPVTPLTDITKAEGLKSIKDAIDEMVANGATNVPEGLAWGWRVVSGRPPFTEGRPDKQKGNDKVVIVLTDGANTYYTPGSLGATDNAGNMSIYSNYGYAKNGRIFEGTSVNPKNYSNSNYTKAMNEHFAQLCDNAKQGEIIVMTVALDLSNSKKVEREQIEALRACASESRFRKDENGKPAKLFWNATGADLSDKFREIADELSNLRIVG